MSIMTIYILMIPPNIWSQSEWGKQRDEEVIIVGGEKRYGFQMNADAIKFLEYRLHINSEHCILWKQTPGLEDNCRFHTLD